MNDLDNIPLDAVKGVGPARQKLFGRLGVRNVAEALRYLPRAYSDRREVTRIAEAQSDLPSLIVAEVVSVSLRMLSWRKSVLTVKVSDGTGDLYAAWFNQPYLKTRFAKGKPVALFGKITVGKDGRLQMASPEVELSPSATSPSPHLHRIVPIYPATEELSPNVIRTVMHRIVAQYADRVTEFLPSATRGSLRLLSLSEAIRNIHFPESLSLLEQARRRLIFQELFLLQCAAALRRKFVDAAVKDRPGEVRRPRDRADRFLSRLPFPLTSAQRRSIEEIQRDLASPHPMNRLVHGDVGCGKTIVAVWAVLRCISSGEQCALMAPTEILAGQHFSEISNLLNEDKCRTALLVGSSTGKDALRRQIARGDFDLVIGTHTLFQEGVRFRRLGLAIIDEQQRFGVAQRLRLYDKGDCPDLLVLSATPVPRTLCQTLYGDMDISVIDEMPPGRLPVQTERFSSSDLPAAYARLRETLCAGNRAYVVCPKVEEEASCERASAVETFRHLSRGVFSDMRVGLLYGTMPPLEKEEAIQRFRNAFLDILVTTTVIETGIDIPDAAAILITNGECFGLAQLHQMRGRVGRGGQQGYCLVVADPQTDAATERLRVFESTTDGFRIAIEDLRLRGVGEFFGTRQHGLPEVPAANIVEDPEMLQLARKEAFGVVKGDVPLSPSEKEALGAELQKTYGEKIRLGLV
ncbi:MAG: ATP-dependent DNA helicase RecG [bacterium]|nr:ATP-dependent DNA helicase RecG [bacterium]